MSQFRAFRIDQVDGQVVAGLTEMAVEELTEGEVLIEVKWSGINYKDMLAATGRGKILRRFPLNGGVDLSGVVKHSSDARYQPGDAVLVCGGGLSETIDGGYAQLARVPAKCVVSLPKGLSLRESMVIGTAGFTAALAVMRMEQNGQSPSGGPVLVTGATGGVGSFAVDMLSSRGYAVTAMTGKAEQTDYLRRLGASECLDRHALERGTRPLEKAMWGGAVDNAGGETLAWLTRTVKPWGNIASIGLVDDFRLNTTVMPFILRGVSLLGINSIEVPDALREEVWSRLADDLKPRHLDSVLASEVSLDELNDTFEAYATGSHWGRTLVRIE